MMIHSTTVSAFGKVKKVRFVDYEGISWITFEREYDGDISFHTSDFVNFKNLVLWAYEDFLRKGGKP